MYLQTLGDSKVLFQMAAGDLSIRSSIGMYRDQRIKIIEILTSTYPLLLLLLTPERKGNGTVFSNPKIYPPLIFYFGV